jgi:ketosteroid isomerase-like protein
MAGTGQPARQQAREARVIEHMQSENVQEWDRTMATFSHPRYEMPDGTVFDGADEVMQYWIDGRALVPDQTNELIELTHLDDGQVQIEFWLRGTPTTAAEPFEVRLWAVFGFDESDLITGERVFVQPPTSEQIAG